MSLQENFQKKDAYFTNPIFLNLSPLHPGYMQFYGMKSFLQAKPQCCSKRINLVTKAWILCLTLHQGHHVTLDWHWFSWPQSPYLWNGVAGKGIRSLGSSKAPSTFITVLPSLKQAVSQAVSNDYSFLFFLLQMSSATILYLLLKRISALSL